MKKIISLLIMMLSLNSYAQENAHLGHIPLKDLNQNQITLDKYQGKKIYIKAWASWCSICLAGLAEIEEVSQKTNKDIEIITIVSPGHKGEKTTNQFIEWYKGIESDYPNITVLLDEQGELIKQAEISGYPHNLLLDYSLNLKKSIPGHLNSEQILQSINEL
ncbi:TPA: redoxin family protein [Mannheimia haemolytica]